MMEQVKNFSFVDSKRKYIVVSQNEEELIVDTPRFGGRHVAVCEFDYFKSFGMLNVNYK